MKTETEMRREVMRVSIGVLGPVETERFPATVSVQASSIQGGALLTVTGAVPVDFGGNDKVFNVNDANTASVVSSALGIPIARLTPGLIEVAGRKIQVNESQLHKQIPKFKEFVRNIE